MSRLTPILDPILCVVTRFATAGSGTSGDDVGAAEFERDIPDYDSASDGPAFDFQPAPFPRSRSAKSLVDGRTGAPRGLPRGRLQSGGNGE
jgi:hypothetical protein